MVASEGNTSFLRAARDGNLTEVLEYLKGSTDINTSNANGLNALHLASKEGHVNIVTELLTRGANIEAATKKGNTALHIGSLAGQEEVVKILVQSGSKVNAQSQNGFTPLYMASQENHAHVARYLLQNGASPSLATEDGFTPLAVALQQGHEKVVAVLLEHDTKGKVHLPALHIAAKKNDTKSAALLLQNDQNDVNVTTKSDGLVNDTTKSGFTPLHIASHYGNVSVATLLIQKGANVNYRAKNNITPLHVASRWGKANMVTLLLDNGSNIEERTRDGLTPLHCSARSGFENVVDILLERGAQYSAKTKNGLSPLHMAAQGDHVDCARLLLYHKAAVDDVTVDYLTPLHVAGHCGNVKTAKLLLDRKCEPNARALNGFTPLHIACKKNRIKVVELLLKYGASIEATTESGLTPLHVAAFMGHMNIAIVLIQQNANPDFTTVRGETALHLAARANQTDIMRILLRNSATVDARAREQQTPLHVACRLGNIDNVVLLLQHGASPDAATKDLYTPLHIAAKEGHEEVASVLLDHGASLNATTKKGFTPLHIAAKYGNIKVTRILLQKEADPDVQGKNGLTPLHVATHYNHPDVAKLLLENKASPHSTAKNGYTPLHIAAKKNQMDIATTLLEYQAQPNAESKNGFTPLHLAAQEGHADMVSLPLEHKADVNATSQNGLTPIHLAAQEDKVKVAEILVKYTSLIDPQTKAGYTPLHTACHFGQNQMVRYLLNNDASVNATTKLGYTPLHQAAQQGQAQVIQILLKHNASPNAVTNTGQTPLSIAEKLGYVSVVEILKPVTEVTDTTPQSEVKYKVVSPETMQETLLSDSDEEGGRTMSTISSISLKLGDDFMSSSPLFAKSQILSQQPMYLSYHDGEKQIYDDMTTADKNLRADIQETDDDEVVLRQKLAVEEAKKRMMSDIGTTLEYPSYLDKAPDYEAEMRYYTGDTLSPTARKDFIEAESVAPVHAAVPNSHHGGPTGSQTEPVRYSSYSGSSFNTTYDPDNVAMDRLPAYCGKLKWKSFLVSFMVDARGGALRGSRHSGVRIIIPPRKAACPTRVMCRFLKRDRLMHPPPLKEGEALAARILEMGPVGTSFLGPVLLEVPHFASLRGKEREIVVMRSDDGESWKEHPVVATDEAVSDALGESFEELEKMDELQVKRVCRILTTDFPRYFAIVSRVKQEVCNIGPPGAVLSSTVVPQVQAVFSEGAVTKKINVGLQAHPIPPDLVVKLLGNRVAVSPVVTLEPRRRQFHKPITMTIPVPQAALKGMLNQYADQTQAPTLRLLCSLVGGQQPSVWEDITKQTEMTFVNDCVQFMTTVSARFWLFDCQNVNDATRMASELYKESIAVPFMAKFVVFAKRPSAEEGQLRMFCMTDDKVDKTLEGQQKFVEVARSREVEVLENTPQYMEMAGNLVPVTKSGDQLYINFRSFRENRLPCLVRVRDADHDPSARVAFMKEPKLARSDMPQTPICNLNVSLPQICTEEKVTASPAAPKKRFSLREHGIVVEDSVSRGQMKLNDVADALLGDWIILAQQLDIKISDINRFKTDNNNVSDQALAMLHHWVNSRPDTATGNELERALLRINRGDVIRKCVFNVKRVEDSVEEAAARVAMDQSGFDALQEEIGASEPVPIKRGLSLEEEQDLIKESESAAEETSSETGSDKRRSVIEVEGFDDPSHVHVTTKEIPDHKSKIQDEDFLRFAQDYQSENTDILPGFSTSEATPGGDNITMEYSSRRTKASPTEPRPVIVDEGNEAYSDFINDLQTMLDHDDQESVSQSADVDPSRQVHEEDVQQMQKSSTDEDLFTRVDSLQQQSAPAQHRLDESGPVDSVESPGEMAPNEERISEDVTERRDIQRSEEIRDDGTVVKTEKIRSRSVKLLKKRISSDSGEECIIEEDVPIPGTEREEVVEVFEEPPRYQTIIEDIDDEEKDDTKKRQIIHNRMVKKVITRRHSVDAMYGEQNDEYTIDEIIPGTESSFMKDTTSPSSTSSSSDEEEEKKQKPKKIKKTTFDAERKRHSSRETIIFKQLKPDGTIIHHHKEVYPDDTYIDVIKEEGIPMVKEDVENYEEVLPDGTVHIKQVLHKRQVRNVIQRVEGTNTESKQIFEGEVEVPASGTREEVVTSLFDKPYVPDEDQDVTEVLPDGKVIHRKVRRERLPQGDQLDRDDEELIKELLQPGTMKKFTDYDERRDFLDDGSEVTHRHTVIDEVRTVRSRTGSPELIKDRIVIMEQELVPSPHGSPFGSMEDLRESDLRQEDDEYVRRTVQKTLLTETITGDQIEEALKTERHSYDRSQLTRNQGALFDLPPTITITEDNTTPCDEDDYVNYYGLDPTKQDHHDDDKHDSSDDEHEDEDDDIGEMVEEDKGSSSSSDVARLDEVAFDKEPDWLDSAKPADDEVDSARITMKREVHTRTMIDRDGEPHTVVTEETSVEEDTEGGAALRGPMQEIIDEFVEGGKPIE